MTYPKDLITAVAQDILKVPTKNFNAFQKTAASNEEFISQYKLNPQTFLDDPVVSKSVHRRQRELEKQIQSFYGNQIKASGGSEELEKTKQQMLANIRADAERAIINDSIQRTRSIAEKDPKAFEQQLRLSQKSEEALSNVYGKELGTAVGGLAGAAGGYQLGRFLPKKHTGVLQKGLGGLAGATLGGLAGKMYGESIDEKRTGFNHEDQLKPYEIADRMTKRNG